MVIFAQFVRLSALAAREGERLVRLLVRLAVAAVTFSAALVNGPSAAQAMLLSPAADGVGAPSHVVVHQAGPGAVRVSWRAQSRRGVRAWLVHVVDSDDGELTSHDRLALPGRRSLLVDGLPTGSTATATVAAFTGTAAVNTAPPSPTGRVTTGLCGGARRQCVSVDVRHQLGRERHIAQGFLHGLDVTDRGAHYLHALDPRFWRVSAGDRTETQHARRYTGDTTAVLSDAWAAATRNPQTGVNMSPWQDWTAYRRFIAAQVRARIADHDLPDYWEVQNEPDVTTYYNPQAPPSASLVLQQFRVAYRAITRVLPHAKVIGPSLSAYTLVGDAQRVGFTDFIDYATAHRLRFAAVSWHEVNAGNPSDAQRQLPGLADRIQTVRTLLTESPVLRHAGIFVNEFDSAWVTREAGWDLGHVAALEQGRVAQANRACFEMCTSGADSVLDPNDGTTPRMTYWGRLAYARMSGQRIGTTTSDRDTTAMAALGGNRLTVIVSRHNECALHTESACPTRSAVPLGGSGDLVVPVRLPDYVSGAVTVQVTQLSATSADAPVAPKPTAARYRIGASHLLRLRLPNITDGAATVVAVGWS